MDLLQMEIELASDSQYSISLPKKNRKVNLIVFLSICFNQHTKNLPTGQTHKFEYREQSMLKYFNWIQKIAVISIFRCYYVYFYNWSWKSAIGNQNGKIYWNRSKEKVTTESTIVNGSKHFTLRYEKKLHFISKFSIKT